ncbi:SDR family oxidoreductase [Chryseosolibacter indicus]|uniref:SDR family oxidoreductase n=1 Tax=Chryseosolibacter indicus TaxID=2782351 RepID=A0ABS5VSA7_9BACT|nr:SDR family oxidoreductase [Chryseosolibacter indicus]MBT1704319.1 SDR family oxidoreductase [Chryseosolibacter indicus]
MKKVILITGASRGIGAEAALLASRKGYHVCLNYCSNKEAADSVIKTIEDEGGSGIAIQADISKEDEVDLLFSTMDRKFGRLDALVNNAGILESQMELTEMSAARIKKIFETNVFGSFYCTQRAITRMALKHGGTGGSIVNVSSVASRTGSPFEYIDYASSKGAIDTFTIGLSKEIASQGIRVNAVRPGFIYTDIHACGGDADRVDKLRDHIPMKRGGYPEEVAAAILWLLSEEASYVSGSFIEIAGGR